MFSLEMIQNGETAANIPELSWEERRFQSPDGRKMALYSEPNEFHMGSYDWKLSFFENGRDVTRSHPAFAQQNANLRFLVPPNFKPWSQNGDWLSLATSEPAHFHYNVPRQQIIRSRVSGLVHGLLWSPKILRYIVSVYNWQPVRSQSIYVAVPGLSTATQLNVDLRTEEDISLWWLKCGTSFLALYRSSKQTFPVVELFDGETGRSEGKISADPNKFVPYDEAKYRHISRDRFSLQVSPSTRCVGDFLDIWHKSHFDANTDRLFLSVYRPSNEEIYKQGEALLPVKEQWCTLQLKF